MEGDQNAQVAREKLEELIGPATFVVRSGGRTIVKLDGDERACILCTPRRWSPRRGSGRCLASPERHIFYLARLCSKILTAAQRIEKAKAKMERVLDHFLYLLELQANNKYVVYSPSLASQIPTSYAANAFRVFERSMHQIAVVRLCALWDRAESDRENIPTVIELIANEDVIRMLTEETRRYWEDNPISLKNPSADSALAAAELEAAKRAEIQFGDEQAATPTTN